MSHHLSVLKAIFQEPISANIHWREIESLLHRLGAKIEPSHGARFPVVLNQAEFIFHHLAKPGLRFIHPIKNPRTSDMRLQRLGMLCAVLGPILWSSLIAVAGAMRPGFSHITQYISELAERGSSTETLMRYAASNSQDFFISVLP